MKKILLVDDAAFMRMILKDILLKNGFEVVGEAANGAIGFEKYKELQPDLVMLDITMPEVTGLECLAKIREYDKNSNCIMCSAMGQQAMVLEAITLGAKDFIVKPFQADRVLESINKII